MLLLGAARKNWEPASVLTRLQIDPAHGAIPAVNGSHDDIRLANANHGDVATKVFPDLLAHHFKALTLEEVALGLENGHVPTFGLLLYSQYLG